MVSHQFKRFISICFLYGFTYLYFMDSSYRTLYYIVFFF